MNRVDSKKKNICRCLLLFPILLSPFMSCVGHKIEPNQQVNISSNSCDKPSMPTAKMSQLKEGRYLLSFVADGGSMTGKSVEGILVLSYKSGAITGYYDGDLKKVGAPIIDGGSAPPPNSQSLISPGVLGIAYGLNGPKYHADMPVLLIGTIANNRMEESGLDGAGIGLKVHTINDDGFFGTWDSWGIVADGWGHFCAIHIRE